MMTETKNDNTGVAECIVEIKSDPYVDGENEISPWTLYIKNSHEYSLYIYSEIFDPIFYSKLFEIIRMLTENDTLHVHINSPGGSITTLVAFINVIQECEADVTMYIDGFAESAAAVLAFAGNKLIVSEHAGVMFHNIHTSSILMQDSGRVKASIESAQSIYKNLLTKFCSNVLSKGDIKNIIDRGTELYFTGQEIRKILSK